MKELLSNERFSSYEEALTFDVEEVLSIIRENLEDEEYTENPPIDYFAYLNEHTPLKWALY